MNETERGSLRALTEDRVRSGRLTVGVATHDVLSLLDDLDAAEAELHALRALRDAAETWRVSQMGDDSWAAAQPAMARARAQLLAALSRVVSTCGSRDLT